MLDRRLGGEGRRENRPHPNGKRGKPPAPKREQPPAAKRENGKPRGTEFGPVFTLPTTASTHARTEPEIDFPAGAATEFALSPKLPYIYIYMNMDPLPQVAIQGDNT